MAAQQVRDWREGQSKSMELFVHRTEELGFFHKGVGTNEVLTEVIHLNFFFRKINLEGIGG